MAKIRLMHKPGSNACRAIAGKTSVKRYKGKRRDPNVVALVNYGLAGLQKGRFYRLYPSAKTIPTINKNVGYSKYNVVKMVERAGILVPETKNTLTQLNKPSQWLEKRVHSIGGKGIRVARGRGRLNGKYYQKRIRNRDYELRVHAFMWMPEWVVQKRLGDKGTIAWNFSNGGHFQTIHWPLKASKEAKGISKKVLSLLNMSFGAIDFIVDNKGNVYFIEINSAPGFSGLSDQIYFEAFNSLANMKKKEVLCYAL